MYGGTAEEMYRLLQDAAKLDDTFAQTADFSMDAKGHLTAGYADIVQAIHIVQDEMGIAGTTSLEAADTIEGSVGSMKAAWDNLVTGLARNDADIEGLIEKVVVSAETAFKNILPIGERALQGIGNLITNLAPIIAQELPMLVNDVAPNLIETGVSFLSALLTGINDNLPVLIEGAGSIANTLVTGILDNLPLVVELGLQLLLGLAEGIGTSLPELIPTIVDVVLQIVETLIDNVDMLIDASIAIILGLADGLISAIPKLLEKAPIIVQKLVTTLVENAPKLVDAALQLIMALTNFLVDPQNIDLIVNTTIQIFGTILNALITHAPEMAEAALQIISALAAGLIMFVGNLTEKAIEISDKLKKSFSGAEVMKKLHDIGWGIIDRIAKGVADTIMIAKDWAKDLIKNFIKGLADSGGDLKKAVKDFIANPIKNMIGFSEPEEGPLSNFHTFAPDMVKLFVQGIRDNEDEIRKQVEKSFNLEPFIKSSFDTSFSMFDNAKKAITGSVQTSSESMRTNSVFNPIAGGISSIADLIPMAVSSAQDAIKRQIIEIKLSIDGREFGHIVTPLVNKENERLGVSLAH